MMAGDKSAKAVQALHKTMVLLRDELAKKNQTIHKLERRLYLNQNKISIEKEVEKEEDDQEDAIEEIDDLIKKLSDLEDGTKWERCGRKILHRIVSGL